MTEKKEDKVVAPAVCKVCDGKGYLIANVQANARYYSPNPSATRVVCWKCQGRMD